MLKALVVILLGVSLFSCDDLDQMVNGKPQKKKITYSYACLDSALGGRPMNRKLEKAGDLIRDLAVSENKITDSVQTQYGLLFHKQMVEEGQFKLIKDPALNKRLNTVLNRLLAVREDPSHIRYAIYALEDTTVNAFTFGGRIYITRAMLKKCLKDDGLLYAIIGHEIGHSEMGHIKKTIQNMELSNKIFGEKAGGTMFELGQILTASFNQHNELEADYYGINLTNELGYDVCTVVDFWREMARQENKYSELEDFFRTHPFSNLRAECLMNHIRTNFGKDCGGGKF